MPDLEWWESDKKYLVINDETLPVEPSKGYTLDLSDYERVDKTEAGTSTRILTRSGIPSISVKFDCNKEMLQTMRSFRALASVTVQYFDPDATNELKTSLMYVTEYQETMLADTRDGGIWSVSFKLEDLEDV